MAHQTKDPTNPERWVVVYPAYLDSTKTAAEGRKIGKNKGVSKPDIREVIKAVSDGTFPLPAKIENKTYCRDYLTRGRLRVQLKNADGSPLNSAFPNRRALYTFLAEKIRTSEDRKKAKEEKEAAKEAAKNKQNSGKRKGGRKKR